MVDTESPDADLHFLAPPVMALYLAMVRVAGGAPSGTRDEQRQSKRQASISACRAT